MRSIDLDRHLRVAAGWSYMDFTAAGVFAELGEGMVSLPSILNPLIALGFNGWLIVETDVTMKPSAAESARSSRDYLGTIGF